MIAAVVPLIAAVLILATDSAIVRTQQLRAYRSGWRCLTARRCSEGHTYRRGCLLRAPVNRKGRP